MRQPDEKLIPSLREWPSGTNWKIWLASNASFESAIAYGQILWPPFKEYKESVFLAHYFNEKTIDEWALKINNKCDLERMCNHEHILSILGTLTIVANAEQLDYVGKLLPETWSCKLRKDYPERFFDVEYMPGTPDSLIDYQITFSERAPQNA